MIGKAMKKWIKNLVDDIGNCMSAHGSDMGPWGFRYNTKKDFTEIIIFPHALELVGEDLDGEIAYLGFSIDLEELQYTFEQIETILWSVSGIDSESDCPFISIEGIYKKNKVFLQIQEVAPEEQQPNFQIDVETGKMSMKESKATPKYTKKQGQYLAYIKSYTKKHKKPPAKADIQKHFKNTPATVNKMIAKLEKLGLISRESKKDRSIKVLLASKELPKLE